MPRPPVATFARLVAVPENHAALSAARQVAECVASRKYDPSSNPLFLHGPPGTGKTFLVTALIEEVTRRTPDLVVAHLTAGDWKEWPAGKPSREADSLLETARTCDLLIVEDLQHLSPRAVEPLVQVLDHRLARQAFMVFTCLTGPCHLPFAARLTSRLACGLVVALEPLQATGRLALLEEKAQRRQLAVSREVLSWLAEHLTGGRQLEGAVHALEVLSRNSARPLELAQVADYFREQAEAGRPTVERIVREVGRCFQVEPRQLQSGHRGRKVLLPRQIGMYLARQLTALSLQEIGSYFGGRDHSTVLHACRKVEDALAADPVLSGTVRQLHSSLG
ncbi:MAG: ATP-binding protein [Planctomycetes bacterium]|nr:ATP-binding protein [Planctomycetota bacterium]